MWGGNENCEDVIKEVCELEDVFTEHEYPSITCTPGELLQYYQPHLVEEIVTLRQTKCTPAAGRVCRTTLTEECIDVPYEECTETLVPSCVGGQFDIPYQPYDHRLKCIFEE